VCDSPISVENAVSWDNSSLRERYRDGTQRKGKIIEAYTTPAPENLSILLYADPIENSPIINRDIAIVYGDAAYRMYGGCPGPFACILLAEHMYIAFSHGDCESDDYNKTVLELNRRGIRCIYIGGGKGC
jgi:hypothetical protein